MEHRNGQRYHLRVQVQLWRGQEHCGSYWTDNISYGGLFLRVPEGRFKRGSFLEARIVGLKPDSEKSYTINAIVIHQTNHGIGLMWADCNNPFFNTLEAVAEIAA